MKVAQEPQALILQPKEALQLRIFAPSTGGMHVYSYVMLCGSWGLLFESWPLLWGQLASAPTSIFAE